MYDVRATTTFQGVLRKHRRDGQLLLELEKTIERLRLAPHEVGGRLHGDLHGLRSTRLARRYRLLFSINENAGIVVLEALDHRKDIYD